MNLKEMIKQIIKLNLEQYFFYMLSLITSVIFFFIEITLYNLYVVVLGQKNILVLPSIAVFNTALWGIFTYIAFMKHREQNFNTLLALGLTHNELKLLILLENMFNFFIYITIGLLLGTIFSKIIILFIFKASKITFPLFSIKPIIYIITILNYVLLNIIFILCTFKFINDLSILNITDHNAFCIPKLKKENVLKFLTYALTLSYVYLNERMQLAIYSRYYIDYALICIITIYILISIFIKSFVFLIKKNKDFYYKRILLINELISSLNDNKIVIFFIAFLNFIFIICDRLITLPNVKTLFNTHSIFQIPSFNRIYIFIVLISFIASVNILYFKIKIDYHSWEFRKIKLYNLGLTDAEIATLLICNLKLIFFSPMFLTTISSIIYLCIFKFNKVFVIYTIKMFIYYFIIQILGYIFTKIKILKLNKVN